jgi:hypothetical protein
MTDTYQQLLKNSYIQRLRNDILLQLERIAEDYAKETQTPDFFDEVNEFEDFEFEDFTD